MLSFWFSGVDGCMVEEETLTSGMVGKKVELEFSSDWDDLTKTVVFMAGSVTRDVVGVSDMVTIPAEILAVPMKQLYVGVYGVSPEGSVTPTVRAAGPVIQPGTDPSGDEGTHPDLPIWAQLKQEIDDLKAYTSDSDASANIADAIPAYWESHLAKKIAAIKELQMAAGKDCYSFVVVADYHRYSNLGKRSPVLIKKVMEECGVKFCLCLGDIQNGGAWKTKELELAEWEEIENEFIPIRDRTLMIPGNHDGAYGSADINGDGEISGTTDYYIYNLSPDEMYDLVYRKVSLINGVHFDESYNGYYVDDTAGKVRYILVNTHYSDGAVNEDGTAVNNYMRKIRVGQPQMDMVIGALQSVPDGDWHIVVGMHIPLAALGDSGPSGDMVLLRDILEAYHGRTTYANTFRAAGEYDYVSVNADFSGAKGMVAGVFCGHIHQDDANTDYAFPVIASVSDDTTNAKIDGAVIPGEAGTITEQSFDVITVNKRTGIIYATKIGYGEDRVFGDPVNSEDTATAYTNLADPASEDWYNSGQLSDGVASESTSGKVVTNYIPVIQGDILRFKGLDTETMAYSTPVMAVYDENKEHVVSLYLSSEMAGDGRSIYEVLTTDENGVISYTILMRGTTGAQFTYGDFCTKAKYIRFNGLPLTTIDDIVITVNEEIV